MANSNPSHKRTTNSDYTHNNAFQSEQAYLPSIDSKKATRALLAHIDVATYASIEQSGTIDDIPINEKAIATLAKNKLGFMIDELHGFQLSGAVTRYIQHTTQTSRLRASSQTLAGLVEELESKIETYHTLKRRDSSDIDYFESDIKEWVVQIIDELSQATLHFSYQVHNVLNIIADLDIRISENENALRTIDNLNIVFRHLSIEKLSTLARNDDFLQPLLLRLLKSKLDQSISELIQAGHQLRHNLMQLQQDRRMQTLNEVVDEWYQHFTKNPTFTPDISLIMHGEPCFNIAEALTLTTYPSLDDPIHDAFISGFGEQIANQLKPLSSQDNVTPADKNNKIAIDDVSQLETQMVIISPFYQAIEQFFEALTTENGLSTLSGTQAWHTFFDGRNSISIDDVEITLEDWLLGLTNHFYTHQSVFLPKLDLSFEEHSIPHYSGNHIVSDIIISHADVESPSAFESELI
ncbi:hypothetical protein [Psychrobacter sp. AOP7-B1-24]|uniref:hypothetical protein n=1 Tax=Psychrobacter sp. AOP7-B1-24 TaxID=3457645 RepID=UPI00402B200D